MASWFIFTYCAFAGALAMREGQRGRHLVFNGTDATEVVPWQVHVYGCGGAIISPTIILTTAHCNGTFAIDQFVWAGFLKASNERLTQQRVIVEQIFDQQHKLMQYKNPVTGMDSYSSENDYMLVRIAPPWNFNSKVGNASLPTQNILGYSTSELELTGWGMMDGGNYSVADTLQKASVTYVNCTDHHNGQFCAGGKKGGLSDGCVGDAGNPLVVKGTSTLVGIAAWGGDVDDDNHDCNVASTNGTKFTEVYQILDFINEALANDSDAQTPALLPLSANTSECNTIPQPDLANRTCKFPFESYGLWHTGCTNLFEYEKLGNLWCATGSDEWAYCSESCPRSEYIQECHTDSDCEDPSKPMCAGSLCCDRFRCRDGTAQIPAFYVCDGMLDCSDQSDEADCVPADPVHSDQEMSTMTLTQSNATPPVASEFTLSELLQCPRGADFYRDPTDCHKFYRCVSEDGGFTIYNFQCGGGNLVFNEDVKTCVFYDDANPPCDESAHRKMEEHEGPYDIGWP